MKHTMRKSLFVFTLAAAWFGSAAGARVRADDPAGPGGATRPQAPVGSPALGPAANDAGLAANDAGPAAPAPSHTSDPAEAAADEGFSLQRHLPPSLAQSVDVMAWGWFSYLHTSSEGHDSYTDVDLALGVTKRFGDRVAASADMHFLDSDDHPRGFLEQAFITADLTDPTDHAGTLLTAGKFNARFGVEPRDAWDRLTGTTSLLFGAQPQDLIGLMLTQPLGDTRVTLRPFVVNGFAGRFDFDQPPSAGLTVEYRPRRDLSFAVTNWVGPGFVHETYGPSGGAHASLARSESDAYGAAPAPEHAGEYASGYANGYAYGYGYAFGNWRGPRLEAGRGGTLYFLDARVSWNPRPDLTLAAEGLLATTGPSAGRLGWGGALVLANYDLTDRWRVFARWSFLDDVEGFVTGTAQRRHELSGGVGFQVVRGVELRGEYRHDFSDHTGDLDSVSAHLTFAF